MVGRDANWAAPSLWQERGATRWLTDDSGRKMEQGWARGRDLRPEAGPKNHPAEFLEKCVPLLIRGQKETIEEADKMGLGAEAALRILDEWEAQYQAKCAAAAAQ
jgi:hypothetical protein